MIRHADSHVDHGLTEVQLRFLFDRFADRRSFFIETISLPVGLGTVPCGLYGPLMGDATIGEEAVTYAVRGTRAWASRLVNLPTRPQHEVTVIAGPHEESCQNCLGIIVTFHPDFAPCRACRGAKVTPLPCVLYTAFGGPATPQEPYDPSCKDPGTSALFWRQHALAK